MTSPPTRKDFPKNFIFGAATSAYQIEGHAFGGAGKTHWDTFAKAAGNVVNNETGAVGCDHYHRFEEDLDLMHGFDAYRFSTSWARVLPEGRGQINQEGIDFYDRLVDAMLARGLKPFLTLYHWELPAALAEKGGWTNPDIANWFGDFIEIVIDRLGDRLASVATFNEPWCITYLSHYLGHHAPGQQDIKATALSVHNVLRSHAMAMDRLRSRGQNNLGIVINFEAVQPYSTRKEDIEATLNYDAVMNRLFVQPILTGTYPEFVQTEFVQHLPANWQDDMQAICQPIDWLGVNYYTQKTISNDANSPWPNIKFHETQCEKTQMGWDIYPDGLYEILNWLKTEFGPKIPIFVTENGMAWDDKVVGAKVSDPERIAYIGKHLQQIKRAINDGCNIHGFFYWSLLDNFEWAYGYEKRFGLVHVDFESQKRTPKESFYTYKIWIS